MAITVNGQKVKVLDKGGYNHDIGQYWKMVEIDGQRQMVVGGPGYWRLWTGADRARPLREAMAKGWPKKGWDE
jgi:hypothetical protein